MEVEVRPSGPTRFSMPLDAAILRFKTAEAATAGRVSARRLVTVADAAAGGRTLWIGDPAPLVVPAGTYRVATGRGTSRLFRDVQATAGAAVDIDLGPALGRLSITAADRDGGPPLAPMLFTVTEDAPDTKTGRREVARSAAPHLDLELPPGTYYVTARHGMAEARDTIAVGPSETLTRTMIMPIARLNVSAKIKGGAGTPPEDATHRILKSDAGAVSEIARAVGPTPEFILPAGRYTIESKIGHQNAIAGADITIAAGQHYRVAVEHTAGEVHLKLVDPGGKFSRTDVHWDIRDASDRSVWRTVQREPQAILAAGRYKVRVEARDRRVESAFEVRVGEARRIEITVE
jgi:Ca-activated chloride channel family protein